jgi:Fe-S cluster biogenesis protein NfuA/nitrite reductase/ring-hydroxylating ferredoxin subunit
MEFDEAVARLDELVTELELRGDDRGIELLQLVDAVHRPALALIAAGELDHPIARAVLAMYDLAPVDERILVEEALDAVRPYIHSHGGEVELVAVEHGVVEVRLSGACQGCAGSAMTLRRGIEEALREGYAGFERLVAHEPERPTPLVQLQRLRRPVFVEVPSGEELAPGQLRSASVDGVAVVLVNVEGEIYAFRDGCTVDGLPLEGARLAGAVLVCPWHNCAYDARSGKRIDQDGEPGLAPVPIALEGGALKVAVNVA